MNSWNLSRAKLSRPNTQLRTQVNSPRWDGQRASQNFFTDEAIKFTVTSKFTLFEPLELADLKWLQAIDFP